MMIRRMKRKTSRLVQDAAAEFHRMNCTPADATGNVILKMLKNQQTKEFQWRLQQLHL